MIYFRPDFYILGFLNRLLSSKHCIQLRFDKIKISIFCMFPLYVKHFFVIVISDDYSFCFYKICLKYVFNWNYSRFYLHFWLPCFLSNCLQNAQNAVLGKLIFQNFLGEDTPRPLYKLAPAALAN